MKGSDEAKLVLAQSKNSISVFQCDGHVVLSDWLIALSNGEESRTIGDMKAPTVDWGHGQTFANAHGFRKAWTAILEDGMYKPHDWVAKLDADAVFIPERLRFHIKNYPKGGAVYVHNWAESFGLLGPLEIASREAWDILGKRQSECYAGKKSGEDGFFAACMDRLGVTHVEDVSVLLNKGQGEFSCYNGWAAAFHPFKQLDDWVACYNKAMPGTSITK